MLVSDFTLAKALEMPHFQTLRPTLDLARQWALNLEWTHPFWTTPFQKGWVLSNPKLTRALAYTFASKSTCQSCRL